MEIRDKDSKELVAVCQASLFIRGIGGFGYKGTLKSAVPNAMPKREADFTGEEPTTGGGQEDSGREGKSTEDTGRAAR